MGRGNGNEPHATCTERGTDTITLDVFCKFTDHCATSSDRMANLETSRHKPTRNSTVHTALNVYFLPNLSKYKCPSAALNASFMICHSQAQVEAPENNVKRMKLICILVPLGNYMYPNVFASFARSIPSRIRGSCQ